MPEFRVVTCHVVYKARRSYGVVEQFAIILEGVLLHQPIPGHRQLADLVRFQVQEAVQGSTVGDGFHVVRRQDAIRFVTAIPQHEARPVLAGVILVLIAKVLNRKLGLVVVLDDLNRVSLVAQVP